jgi:uncharacterized membrane protein YccC
VLLPELLNSITDAPTTLQFAQVWCGCVLYVLYAAYFVCIFTAVSLQMRGSIEAVLAAVKKVSEENASLKRSIARGELDSSSQSHGISRSADGSRSRTQFSQQQVSRCSFIL